MATRFYPAVITREPHEGGEAFNIQFLDIPQVISWGRSLEQAIVSGREAFALAVDDMKDIPEPTPFDEAPAKVPALDIQGAYWLQLVEVQIPEAAVRVNITLPGDLVKRIDAVAGNYGRSEFLATAAREKLARVATAAIPEVQLNAVMDAIGQGLPLTVSDTGEVRMMGGSPFDAALQPRKKPLGPDRSAAGKINLKREIEARKKKA